MNLLKILFWGFLSIISLLTFNNLSHIIIPFALAFIIAYLLDPVINSVCRKYHLSRTSTASIIFILFLSLIILAALILAPIIYKQMLTLISKITIYESYFRNDIIPHINKKLHLTYPNLAEQITTSLQNFFSGTINILTKIFSNIWNSALATINMMTWILLVPLILFYFLRDWHKIKNIISSLLPIKYKDLILNIVSDITNILSAYIRGQLNICLILAGYYSIGLTMIGLDLSLLMGLLSGFLIIIPFIGPFIALCLALIIGYTTFGASSSLIYILVLYLVGYLGEGYFLTPKIIGDKIGLHPLWIMFSVFANGALFGFVGILCAIPIAGIIKVLLKYGIRWYKGSIFYTS